MLTEKVNIYSILSLGDEEKLSGGGPSFQLAVGFRRIGQLEHMLHPELEFAGLNPTQNVP